MHMYPRTKARAPARGFTLAEAIVSTLIVSVMMAGALTGAAKTGTFRRLTGQQQVAHLLAEQLMAEILSKSYWDPAASGPTSIGASTSEWITGNRSAFDDVDDYDGWLAAPPEMPDGTDLVLDGTWYRSVRVTFVGFSDLNTALGSDQGLKRIYVEVGQVRPGGSVANAADRRPVATLIAIAGRGRGF